MVGACRVLQRARGSDHQATVGGMAWFDVLISWLTPHAILSFLFAGTAYHLRVGRALYPVGRFMTRWSFHDTPGLFSDRWINHRFSSRALVVSCVCRVFFYLIFTRFSLNVSGTSNGADARAPGRKRFVRLGGKH